MSEHPIEGMMSTTLEKIKQMVDVNTVVGDPITTPDGTVILPVSKITYGFASGGSDWPTKVENSKSFFGGGTGAGVTVSPVAFIVISSSGVKMLQIDPYNSSTDRVVGMVPDVMDKISSFISSSKKDAPKKKREPEEAKAAQTSAPEQE